MNNLPLNRIKCYPLFPPKKPTFSQSVTVLNKTKQPQTDFGLNLNYVKAVANSLCDCAECDYLRAQMLFLKVKRISALAPTAERYAIISDCLMEIVLLKTKKSRR